MRTGSSEFEFSSAGTFGDWFFPIRLIVVMCVIAGRCAFGAGTSEERFSATLC